MQREVDAIISETLECYDDGAIEEEELAAFGLVLELFNHAIVERRAALQADTLGIGSRRGERPQPHVSTMTLAVCRQLAGNPGGGFPLFDGNRHLVARGKPVQALRPCWLGYVRGIPSSYVLQPDFHELM